MKDHDEPLHDIDFVPHFEDISVEIEEGATQDVRMHDGSTLRLRKLGRDYDPTEKLRALSIISESAERGEVLTGVLYVATGKPTLIDMLGLVDEPLGTLPQSVTRPSREALEQVMEELR